MPVLCLFFSLANFNKSAYSIKERPMRGGERVKLWDKQRPLDSLRELLPALGSLLKLGPLLPFMTPLARVSPLSHFGPKFSVEIASNTQWTGSQSQAHIHCHIHT